jgi:hypothetical protein
MSNNQCQCTLPVWLEWENQMEPGEQCSYCQKREYEDSLSHQEVLSPRMIRLINEAEAEAKAKYHSPIIEKLRDELPF